MMDVIINVLIHIAATTVINWYHVVIKGAQRCAVKDFVAYIMAIKRLTIYSIEKIDAPSKCWCPARPPSGRRTQ